MRARYRAALAGAMLMAVLSLSATDYSTAEDNQTLSPPGEQAPPGSQPGAREPTVTVLEKHEVRGVLGREVRSAADENMGRIVDVLVDSNWLVKAAVIDFGGFLGVGSRKIAVAWDALSFPPPDSKNTHIVLELTRDQVRAAPEYKEDKSVVVLGPSGRLESLPF